MTGEYKGILTDTSKTNLINRPKLYPVNNGIYTSSGIGRNIEITTGQPSIFPTKNSMRITKTNTSQGGIFIMHSTNVNEVINSKMTHCAIIKLNNQCTVRVGRASGMFPSATFNPLTKTVTTTTNSSSSSIVLNETYIQELKENWYYIQFTYTNSSIVTFDELCIDLQPNSLVGASIDIAYVGAFRNTTIKDAIYGIVVNPNNDTISQVTRPADIITLPNYSTLFGTRNQRHIEVDNSKLGFLNEETLQLPVGHNKLIVEKTGLLTPADNTLLGSTSVRYGERTNIKSELDPILTLNPSLVMIPGKSSVGGLQTILPNDGSADFTVSRNGSATFLGSNGLLQTAAANVPRLEYNPDGSFRGVLVEPAATNLLLRSEEFENSYWPKFSSTTVESNSTLAPNNTLTADKLNINTNGTDVVLIRKTFTQNTTIEVGKTYTFSIWIKSDEPLQIRLDINDSPVISFTTTTNWVRYSVTRVNTTQYQFGDFIDIASFGNQSGKYIYLWGAQLEVGSVATSYIPTTTSQVTRPADVIQRTNAQNLIGQTEGSLYIDAFANSINGFSGLVELASPTLSDRVLIFMPAESSGRAEYSIIRNSVQVGSASFTALNNQLDKKVVMIWTSSNLKVFINGQLFVNLTLTQSSPLNQMSIIRFFLIGNNRPPIAYIRRFSLFKTSLTDAEAIALTTL